MPSYNEQQARVMENALKKIFSGGEALTLVQIRQKLNNSINYENGREKNPRPVSLQAAFDYPRDMITNGSLIEQEPYQQFGLGKKYLPVSKK